MTNEKTTLQRSLPRLESDIASRMAGVVGFCHASPVALRTCHDPIMILFFLVQVFGEALMCEISAETAGTTKHVECIRPPRPNMCTATNESAVEEDTPTAHRNNVDLPSDSTVR